MRPLPQSTGSNRRHRAAQEAPPRHRLGGRFGCGRIVRSPTWQACACPSLGDQLSTFGIEREFSAAGWRDLLDQLQFEGLLREDPNDGRPLIGLGEVAGVNAVYRGERRVSMRRMIDGAETAGRSGRTRKRHSGERLGVEAADAPLFDALRAWRRERAAEQRVPPYVIFHDATLSAIARERPGSADELAKVSGVGQSKLKRYGADVLKVVRAN
jgi:ATP-dependent DNA helicase RecQ